MLDTTAPELPANVFPLAQQAVLGEGPVPCSWFFLAEAPGRQEDWAGRPLVGPSGQVFNKLLERFTTLRRPDVYVTNVVKHWPGPSNPTPKVGQCKPYRAYLHWELARVLPSVVVTMGAVAAREFMKGVRLRSMHGNAVECEIPGVWKGILVTWYHPAMAIRNPAMMDVLISDAEKLREEIDRLHERQTTTYYTCGDEDAALQLCMGRWGEYGFDTETTSPTRGNVFATDEAQLVGFSVSGASGTGIYMPTGEISPGMATVLSSPLWTKVCHNSKFELKVLAKAGVELVGWEDTKLAAYLLGYNRTGLKDLVREVLGHQPTTIREVWPKDGPGMENCTWQQAYDTYKNAYEYAVADADNTLRLWPGFKQRLHDEGLMYVYEFEKRLTPVLAQMENTGMLVDVQQCEKVSTILEGNMERARAGVYLGLSRAGANIGELNINAPEQLERVLMQMGAPLTRLTTSKTRKSVDANALHELKDDGWHPEIMEPLLNMRKYRDFRVYVTRFIELRGPDGRLHTSFNQSGHWEESGDLDPKNSPATGRLSSSGPNLMNIPHHRALVDGTDWAVPIRACLIAREGCMLMSVDLGQEEPRIIAVVAEDTALMQGFEQGLDIYHPATSALYPYVAHDMPDDEFRACTKRGGQYENERFVGKTFFLAWYYGAGAARLLKLDPVLTRGRVNVALRELSEAHPARDAYLRGVEENLSTDGYVTSLYGRRRRLHKYWSPRAQVKAEAVREGANDKIQATAADILKLAMALIADELVRRNLVTRLISTVHDEVVLEAPTGEVAEVVKLVAGAFRPLLPGLELEVEASVGSDWGHMRPC